MEKIEKANLKVRRHLASQFGSQDNMEKCLTENVDTDKNGNLSVDEFKTFLIETCGTAILAQKLTKQDLEGFMSSFVYNAQGNTKCGDVSDLVFTDD